MVISLSCWLAAQYFQLVRICTGKHIEGVGANPNKTQRHWVQFAQTNWTSLRRVNKLFLYYNRVTRILDIGAYLHNILIKPKNKVGKTITLYKETAIFSLHLPFTFDTPCVILRFRFHHERMRVCGVLQDWVLAVLDQAENKCPFGSFGGRLRGNIAKN